MIYKKFDLKSEDEKTKELSFNELEVGQKVYGTVINIKPYGAFVKIESGAVGLLHIADISVRSEERRVGKECRSRWSPYH